MAVQTVALQICSALLMVRKKKTNQKTFTKRLHKDPVWMREGDFADVQMGYADIRDYREKKII